MGTFKLDWWCGRVCVISSLFSLDWLKQPWGGITLVCMISLQLGMIKNSTSPFLSDDRARNVSLVWA